MTNVDPASSPQCELPPVRRRIATIEAAREAMRDGRADAIAEATAYNLDLAGPLGDQYAAVLARCEPLFKKHGREFVEQDLWRVATAGGQDLLDQHAPPALAMRDVADIPIEPVKWLWPGRIAAGKLTLIAGEPGTGKSQVALAIAAAIATGGSWPCGNVAPKGGVVIFAAEDTASDTMKPRLIAAIGDDLPRGCVRTVSHVRDSGRRRGLDLMADLHLIEDAVAALGDVRLVIVDPITSYLGRADSHRVTDVRNVLEPVAEMASRLRVGVFAVTHTPKGGGTAAINRFVGSVAYIALARAAYLFTRDPESDDPHRRLFLPVKNNLAPLGNGLAARLEQTDVANENGIVGSRVVWTGEEIARSADDILRGLDASSVGSADRDRLSRLEEAKRFLQDELEKGERPVIEIEQAAERAGIAAKTLRSAREALGIRYRREGFGPGAQYFYGLP